MDGLFLFYPRSDQRQFGVAAADVNLGLARFPVAQSLPSAGGALASACGPVP